MATEVFLAFQKKVCEVYEQIIANINTGKGEIKIGNKSVLRIYSAIRKKDIYAAVATEVGMGCTERMAEKYILKYLREKSGSTDTSECAPISCP